MRGVWWMLVIMAASGAAALEPGQARQAATFVDGTHPDQPALYALLADVAGWSGTAADEAGATLVNWSAVLSRPGDYRAQKVLVEGTDAGRRRQISLVRAQQPWGASVTEWGVGVDVGMGSERSADDARGLQEPEVLPVVVWFVDPADEIGEAVHGRRVRVVGRFLGLWQDVDAAGAARTYPVVVARGVEVVAAPSGREGLRGWGPGIGTAVAAVLGLAVLWRLSRLFGRVDVVGRRRAARRRTDNVAAATEGDTAGGPLPEDPEAALAVLAKRGDQAEPSTDAGQERRGERS
ncbi:MAG: hypothetical protein AAGE65_00570 [Planctomycetota bacterium]